ncbi:MAG: Ig-like domain-containing protein, partial [Anaerolineae bacterium]
MATLSPSRPTNRLPLILALVVAVAAIGGGAFFLLSRSRQAPAANLPPIVVDRAPDRGEEQGTESPIVLAFDKPMDRASVEQSFAISPRIPGNFKWSDDNTSVQFVPSGSGFARGEVYNVTLADTAKAENGKTLGQPMAFTFKAVGFIEVTQVIPADGAQNIDPGSEITVMFNRPIVPLLSATDTTKLPDPITFDPPLAGKGEWLNTSIYVFRPDQRMASGTTYTAKIAAGLQDPTGALLQKDYTWSFMTQLPQVLSTSPSDAETNVWIDRAVQVTFNQPMDHPSTEAAFSLHAGSIDGPKVEGTFTWLTSTVPAPIMPMGSAGHYAAPALGGGGGGSKSSLLLGETLNFTPTQKLERDTQYFIKVAAGAKAEGGGAAMAADYAVSFRTVPPFRIVRTDPADGTSAAPYSSVEIYFSAPVDEATLRAITVTTPISASSVYTYYSDYDYRYVFGFGAGPSSNYEVVIGGEVADKWGVKLGQDQLVRFRTRALPPEQWFDVPGRFGVYSAYTDTVVYVRYRNVSQLNFELYPVSVGEFGQLVASDGWQLWDKPVPVNSQPVRSWSVPVDKPLNQAGILRVPVASDTGGALTTGIYLIRVTSPEQSERDFAGTTRHLIVVANTNLTLKTAEREALVWATDLQSGREVPAATVNLYDDKFASIASGRTDGSGLYKAQYDADREPMRGTIAVLGEPGGSFGVTMNDWNQGIGPWDFSVSAAFYFEPHNVYIYTEKPLYRPGQPVHIKGIVRLDDDARFAIDPNLKQVDFAIIDPLGTQVYTATLPVDDYGSFNTDFTLDKEASLGYYSIQVQIPGKTPDSPEPQMRYYNGTFVVSEYRRPEFQVSVTPKQAEVLQGDTVEVDVEASYFFGGAVGGAKVSWTALSNNYFFDRYQGQGYFSWNDVDYFAPERRGGSGLLASGEGTTDAQGKFTISLPAKLDEKTGSQRFSVEASITDLSDQVVSNRVEVIVHQGRYYIGIAPTDYVGTANKPMSFNLRTVDWQGAPSANQNLDVVYYKRDWFSVQQKDDYGNIFWTSSFSDTAVFTTTANTNDKGEGQSSFTPPVGGEYRVVASGKDDKGNMIRASTNVWVSSQEYIAWRQDNNDRIALVADKKSYNPGDVAKILIPSPYQGIVRALVTVERGRILETRVIDLKTNSDVIEIPITPQMAPNAFVSVVIVKGIDQNDLAPSFKMGYASFTVNREQQILKVTLTPDRDPATQNYAPRQPISYTLKVLDFQGKPVQAEVSLALIDLSVLTLMDPFQQPLPDWYYGERGLSVMTSSSLVFSVDRINIKLAEEAKGGGGGAAAAGGEFFVRGNFPDTAYWNATVTTDANGEAKISTVLPDNLTTWRMLAKAVTKDTLVGEGQVDIRSTKDLLIRPVTPRFMVVGDKLNMAAVVNNNTTAPIDAEVSLEGTGLTIDNGQVKQTVTVPAGGQTRVEWPVTVLDQPYANLTFTARGGGLSDASKPTAGLPPEQYLPIYKFSTPE